MGFTISYKPFFTVRVKEQSSGKAVRSLSFCPTSACDALLNRYQLLFKSRDNGFDVYYKSFPLASAPIQAVIEEKVKFTFGIKIIDPGFITTYEPDAVGIPQYYLDNLKSDGAISTGQNLTASTKLDTADLAYIKQQTFALKTELPSGNEPNEWRIKEKFGTQTLVQAFPIEAPTSPVMPYIYVPVNDPIKHPSKYIDKEGPYLLETDKASPAPATIYLSNAVKQSAVNGVLDIYWNSIQSSAPANTGKAYQIIVKPK